MMKTKVMVVSLLALLAGYGLADTVEWIGASGGKYVEAANWQVRGTGENRVPTLDDIVVYDPGVGVSMEVNYNGWGDARHNPTAQFRNIRVESGTVTFTPTNGDFGGVSGETNEIYVAEGAILSLSVSLYAHERKPVWVMKTGAGDLRLANGWIDENYRLSMIVAAGTVDATYASANSPRFLDCEVWNGAKFYLAGSGVDDSVVTYKVEEGGLLSMSAADSRTKCRGISGYGEVVLREYAGGQMAGFNLSGGPYRFGGTIHRNKSTDHYVSFVNYKANASYPATDEERHFIIDGSDIFATRTDSSRTLACFNAAITPDFGRGIGTFYLPPIKAEPGVKYVLEDEDGEPIRLYANLFKNYTYGGYTSKWQTGEETVEMEGAGDWFVRSGTTTITGNQIRVTGTIGVTAGATLNLGNGEVAAADMSELPFAAIENEGTLNVKNVGAATMDGTISGSGTFNFYSPLTVGCMSIKLSGNNLTVDGGDVTVKGGETTSPQDYTRVYIRNGGKLTLTGRETLFCAPYAVGESVAGSKCDFHTVKQPRFLSFIGSADSMLEITDGAKMCFGRYDCRMPNLSLKDGGTLCVYGSSSSWQSAADATGVQELFSDGGVIGLFGLENYNNAPFPNPDAADRWVAKVGKKGLAIRYDESVSGRYISRLAFNDYLKTVPADGVSDGGVEIEAAGAFCLQRPQNVTGPFVLTDGRIDITKTQVDSCGAGDSLCGAGDLVFNGAWLGVQSLGADTSVRLAPGVGSKAVVRAASRLDLDPFAGSGWSLRGNALDIVLGPDDAAESSLSGEGGGVLYVCSKMGETDGSNKTKVLVKGGVDVRADGTPKVPVVMVKGVGANHYAAEASFAKYDATLGFVNYTDYATDLAAGADKVVRLESGVSAPAGTTTVSGLLLKPASSSAMVTIPSGSTLKVGNGTDPALVVTTPTASSDYALFGGSGTLDFGTSRGVFAIGNKINSNYARQSAVNAKISGQNGVTFSAMPGDLGAVINYKDNTDYALTAANEYDGGTDIDKAAVRVTNPLAFSTGPVTVNGGKMNGGAACFANVGPFANDFTISGYGRRVSEWDLCVQAGALEAFVKGVRITGDVTVKSHARVASPQLTLADGEVAMIFEGQVKGERLEVSAVRRTNGGAYYPTTVVFAQENAALTGGVDVFRSTAILRGAKPSLGTGRILLDEGVLRFENTEALVVPNRLMGIGTVQLAGEPEVKFTGDMEHVEAFALDLVGGRHEFSEIPAFATAIGNSSATRATIAFQGGLGTVAWPEGLTLDNALKFDLEIGEGTVLDLGGQALTVRRGLDGAAKRVVNGTFTELKPQGGMLFLVR